MKIHVSHAQGDYAVAIGPSLLGTVGQLLRNLASPPTAIGLVTDDVVESLHLQTVLNSLEKSGFSESQRALHVVSSGEQEKRVSTVEAICSTFAARGVDRSSIVVSVGGGVVCDLAGFAASVYMRGIPVVQCPTTLLAQADASVGGKTGVDLDSGKNLIGTFHQPLAVLADVNALTTLDPRQFRSGMAEIVKAALIGDAELWQLLSREEIPWSSPGSITPDLLIDLIGRAVQVKAAIVAADERESSLRQVLNLGHTYGHAIETASGYSLLHGEAVALGMLAAFQIGVAHGTTEAHNIEKLRFLLDRIGLPTDLTPWLKWDVLKWVETDKKRRGKAIRMVLPTAISGVTLVPLELTQIAEYLRISPR